MNLFKFNKDCNNKIDQYSVLLDVYCYINNIKLTKTEVKALAYFIVYGLNKETVDLVIKSDILTHDSLKNSMSRFRKSGFIRKKNKDDVLEPEFDIKLDKTFAIFIKVDNI